MIKDKEVAIVSSSSKALEVLDITPNVSVEDLIKKLVPVIEVKEEYKLVVIASINESYKLKKKEKNLSKKQIIQKVLSNLKDIDLSISG